MFACTPASKRGNTLITGSGSTFIAPLMAAWSTQYHEETGVQVNYQATGSGAGIRQAQEGIVDFAASDMPLDPDTLMDYGLMQFPIASGAIVPVINVAGIVPGELILDGPTLADIFTGEIKNWHDPKIADLNPTVDLPDTPIVVIYRSDGSGTTYNFVEYLSKISDHFKNQIGVGTSVSWPSGIGSRGNAGVAAAVGRTLGSIGYVEYAYIAPNDLTWTQMVNHDGQIVRPSIENLQAATQGANWEAATDYYLSITDQPGKGAWPIAANTFILLPKFNFEQTVMQQQLDFFKWAFEQEGESIAYSLDFVPLPQSVQKSIQQDWVQLLNNKPMKTAIKVN